MSHVTFGRMERDDPSTPTMDFYLDNKVAGYIEAATEDVNARSPERASFRVIGYNVLFFANDIPERYFEPANKSVPARTVLAEAKRHVVDTLSKRASKNPPGDPGAAVIIFDCDFNKKGKPRDIVMAECRSGQEEAGPVINKGEESVKKLIRMLDADCVCGAKHFVAEREGG